MENKFGKTLNFTDFNEIMKEVNDKHRFGGLSKSKGTVCRNIKYVEPVFDMRTNDCFYIKFRGIFGNGEKEFDFRDSSSSMYERIVSWLNGHYE